MPSISNAIIFVADYAKVVKLSTSAISLVSVFVSSTKVLAVSVVRLTTVYTSCYEEDVTNSIKEKDVIAMANAENVKLKIVVRTYRRTLYLGVDIRLDAVV